MTDEQVTQSPEYKDRKAWLVAFGILEIIFGGFCALGVVLIILSMMISSSSQISSVAPMNARMMIPSVLIYVMLSTWFICMGIGSIRARRWARALILVSSWIGLVCGLSGLITMLLIMPDMFGKMAGAGQMPQGFAVVMKYVMIGFMIVFYVIIPGVLVLFYRSKHVKATCEFWDPQIRWTDKCPLPVLASSLMFGFWAISMLQVGFYGWAIPFFGSILTGISGAVVSLAAILLFAYAAWGSYKLSIKAWWCSLLLIVTWAISMGITFSSVSIWDYYEKMGLPEQQLDMIKQIGMPQGSSMALLGGLWVIVLVGYLVYTKRYFVPISEQDDALYEDEIAKYTGGGE